MPATRDQVAFRSHASLGYAGPFNGNAPTKGAVVVADREQRHILVMREQKLSPAPRIALKDHGGVLMSQDANSPVAGAIPPGWYPDPAGGEGKRWWDGAGWTTHLQEPPAAPPLPTFGNYVPAELRSVRPLPTADAGIAYTRAAWWIAFSPIWSIVPQAIIVESVNSVSATPISDFIPGLAALNMIVWAFLVWLAFIDRTKLHSLGNNSAASPWWVLLTPLAYLIVRAQHVRLYATGAWAMVIWWSIAVFVTPGLAVLGIFGAYGIFGN